MSDCSSAHDPRSLLKSSKTARNTFCGVSIHKRRDTPQAFREVWFNTHLNFNNGLVAIVGNKGSGKSALLDVLGLVGKSHVQDAFSFLNGSKFCKPPDVKAQHFEATIEWKSGDTPKRQLDGKIRLEETEAVKYVPQGYFESICTQLPEEGESAFDRELKSVIFSHVSKSDRLNQTSLDALIKYRTEEIAESIDNAKRGLSQLNLEILNLEQMTEPSYREAIGNQLAAKQDELRSIEKQRPPRLKKPIRRKDDENTLLDKAERRVTTLKASVETARKQRTDVTRAGAD